VDNTKIQRWQRGNKSIFKFNRW